MVSSWTKVVIFAVVVCLKGYMTFKEKTDHKALFVVGVQKKQTEKV